MLSPLQLFDIAKLLYVVKAFVLRYPVRIPTARLLPLPFLIGPAATDTLCESALNLLQLPFHIGPAVTNLLCQSTPSLLQLLPFHTGPAANNLLCESTVDLLSQLPYFIVDAVYELLLLLLLLYGDSHLLVSTNCFNIIICCDMGSGIGLMKK